MKIKIISSILLLVILLFSGIYIKIRVENYIEVRDWFYTISEENNEESTIGGVFHRADKTLIFILDTPNIDYNDVTLFYKKENADEQLIVATTQKITIMTSIYSKEYFDLNNIDYIRENMYARFTFDDEEEKTIKLKFTGSQE